MSIHAGRILIVAHTFPLPDMDGSSLRTLRLVQMLRELGWTVTFLSAGREFHPAYTARNKEARSRLAAAGVETVGPIAPLEYLHAHGANLDAIMLAVTPGEADFLAQARRVAPNALILYDTIELTFVSMARAAHFRRSERLMQQSRGVQAAQLRVAATADLTLVVTDDEAELVRRLCPQARVGVVSNIHSINADSPGPDGRRDLLFVGNFVHMPNRDAAQHLVTDIWPQVRDRLPGAVVRLAGLPIAEIETLAAPDVLVTGHVADLAPLYANSRVAIAPLRFGAGIKGKVLEAMGNGLPVVMTPVAAEGIGAHHNDDALIATTPTAFAQEIIRLYGDDRLWQRLARNGQALVEQRFSYNVVKQALAEQLRTLR
jgi:glycosyltransferase involved in cell wall biosynthesis